MEGLAGMIAVAWTMRNRVNDGKDVPSAPPLSYECGRR
ncbi:hypothetical protein PVE_P0086 (plasmid) [Pseudomonas veronii 1YdBTEX2]|uniref:Uncharacterized protein n=1 Tax=Pseudomonas veronii 1YdBTEX2 TaxID=1295141 RepID=A0A1D3K9Z2_PSEVE|nr:hypothetical protein PVE_P0086 [Pseudomonas veronii 1YdBTEX2]